MLGMADDSDRVKCEDKVMQHDVPLGKRDRSSGIKRAGGTGRRLTYEVRIRTMETWKVGYQCLGIGRKLYNVGN